MKRVSRGSFLNSKNIILKIGIILIFAVVSVGIFFAIKEVIKNFTFYSDIKVGDTVITGEQKKNLKKDIESDIAENPDVDYLQGKSIEDVVNDKLILNALLKKSAKECNIDVDYSDVAIKKTANISDSEYESNYKNSPNKVIFYENEILQEKLRDCLIKDKSILVVQSLYYGPYYDKLSSEERKVAYNDIK